MNVQLFKNESFGEVRVSGTSEEPLFCLADICKVLDLQNPSTVKNRLDAEDVQLIDLHALNYTEGMNGNSKANFVTESGFYDVILQSSSPKVKPFRKWVTSEVLPSIRKTDRIEPVNLGFKDNSRIFAVAKDLYKQIRQSYFYGYW